MTNAGKTHTVVGAEDAPGLLPRTLSAVFSHIITINAAPAAETSLTVQVSCVEIYNEQVFDLLGPAPVAGKPAAGAASAAGVGEAARVPLMIKDGRYASQLSTSETAYIKARHFNVIVLAEMGARISRAFATRVHLPPSRRCSI
jgi:hypothetical protein